MFKYGDIEAFGVFPDWQRQLAKFASLQDRLREWDPAVRSKVGTPNKLLQTSLANSSRSSFSRVLPSRCWTTMASASTRQPKLLLTR